MRTLLFFLALIPLGIRAQSLLWSTDNSVKVSQWGDYIQNAWAGGMNMPQFSEMDLDGDGMADLVVFERQGHVLKTFLNKGSKGKANYLYTPQYEKYFPSSRSWMLLRDFNRDGKPDIFASSSQHNMEIELWENISTRNGEIKFEKKSFDYKTPWGTEKRESLTILRDDGTNSAISLFAGDIPSLEDIDGDGLPDVMAYGLDNTSSLGMRIEYYRNRGDVTFVREDICWGGFAESYIDNSITLEVCAPLHKARAPLLPQPVQIHDSTPSTRMMHSGSTLLAIDMTGDGLKDMLIGGISFSNTVLAINGGTPEYARMTQKDDHFPSYDIPVSIDNFPAFYAVDTDNDGQKEILVTPSNPGSENVNCVWMYKNTGTKDAHRYTLQTTSFLQEEMIDVGEASRVVFHDLNRDGLPDMFVSGYSEYNQNLNGGEYVSKISHFRNTGTKDKPEFEMVSDDFCDFSKLGKLNLYLAFADLSGDGRADILLCDDSGALHYFTAKRDGGFVSDTYNLGGLNLGNAPCIKLWDTDGDGLIDLIVGNSSGEIRFYKNIGTATRPEFRLETKNWLGLDFSDYRVYNHGVNIEIFSNGQKNYLLACVEELVEGTNFMRGKIHMYELMRENGTSHAKAVTEDLLGIRLGDKPSAGYFRTGSGTQYLATGSGTGGLRLFSTKESDGYQKHDGLIIAPNPTDGIVKIIPEQGELERWELFSLSGMLVRRGTTYETDLSGLQRGIYILRCDFGTFSISKKVIFGK